MSILLALETILRQKVEKAIAHSAAVYQVAEEFTRSGLVSEHVFVTVAFEGSSMKKKNQSANLQVARVKTCVFKIKVYYKNSQRHGHIFALAMLDSISESINGYVPLLDVFLSSGDHPAFQTGFELDSESQPLFDEKSSIYSYEQSYTLELIQAVGERSHFACPIPENPIISLAECLPCKRCLKTTTGHNVGIAEWLNPKTNERMFVEDQETCPIRPTDLSKIEIIETIDQQKHLHKAELIFTPNEAMKYSPEIGVEIDEQLQTISTLERFYYSEEGTPPSFCQDFSVVFGLFATSDGGKIEEQGNEYHLGGAKIGQ
ncbi:MAG: hypothetical protein ACRC80_19705 [Waterburya sp.]